MRLSRTMTMLDADGTSTPSAAAEGHAIGTDRCADMRDASRDVITHRAESIDRAG